ncbi:histidine phosphatase family protein [Rhizobium sp. G21]|uniref:histidine phosphatase family protein n=1 Tax=Rhizobium sp. G21 TaxID=2758439 RepID=UPI00160341E8|nr:histidine phosphatase family protein [Rhizobium sp. G21]MBB1248649.1 histidine phosphatase family protein [Rhizobium sp. G21]
MSLYIIRHGQTAWNAEWRLQGQKDIPLNDLGRRQAAENGLALARLEADLTGFHFVSSPLGRARETMEILRRSAGVDPTAYEIEDRLKEICFGDWEGRTSAEISVDTPDRVKARKRQKWDFIPPGDNAESYEILSWRVGSWYRAIERPTVAVCHGGVIRCLFKLSGTLDKDAAAKMEVPQDKILRRADDGTLEWV